MSIEHFYYRATNNLKNRFMYPVFLYKNSIPNPGTCLKRLSFDSIKFHGQPRNHNFRVYNKKLYPSFKLFERWNTVAQLIPHSTQSLIDLACCRGFYVLQSIVEYNIQRAVGIDIDSQFLRAADHAKSLLQEKKASFYLKTLDNITTENQTRSEKFDIVLLTGAYHYFYWGSGRSKQAYRNHHEILSRLASLCSDRLIISARFDVHRLPHQLRKLACKSPDAKYYTLSHFLNAASQWFNTRQVGLLGEYPLYVLTKK